jgi:hypothetical protein
MKLTTGALSCSPRPEKLAPRDAQTHAPLQSRAEITDLGRAVLSVLRENQN